MGVEVWQFESLLGIEYLVSGQVSGRGISRLRRINFENDGAPQVRKKNYA